MGYDYVASNNLHLAPNLIFALKIYSVAMLNKLLN